MNPHGLQVFSLFLAIGLLVLSLIVAIRRSGFRLLMVPPASLAVLLILFYVGVLTHWLPSGDVSLFISAVLRAAELLVVIGGLGVLLLLTHREEDD